MEQACGINCGNANRHLGILRPLKHKVDRRTLETIYKSFVRPLLEYADILWDSPVEVTRSLDVLEGIQLSAARLVTGATERCNRAKL